MCLSASYLSHISPANYLPSLENFVSLVHMSSVSPGTHTLIPAAEIHQAIARLAKEIASQHQTEKPPLIVGIARGGIPLAHQLAKQLQTYWSDVQEVGQIDISFHRDDIFNTPIPKSVEETALPFDVDDARVILVDDVIFSGRTIRAALNELFDMGRPRQVQLAALFDRGGRCLPIQPDYTGIKRQVSSDLKVVVRLGSSASSQDEISIVATS
jgi:pyrimidine operon attenuation protein/uracil phosphoribosyltransferase